MTYKENIEEAINCLESANHKLIDDDYEMIEHIIGILKIFIKNREDKIN